MFVHAKQVWRRVEEEDIRQDPHGDKKEGKGMTP